MSDEIKKGFRITSDPDITSIEQPGKDPAQEVGQLPLRLVLVSDFTPAASVDDWSDASHLHSVDKNRFAALMQEMAPRLRLDVPNKLGETPKLLEVELAFPNLDAFHPEQVVRQVPALAPLLEARVLVGQAKGGSIDLETLRERLEAKGADAAWVDQLARALAAPPPKAASKSSDAGKSDDTLDRLLGMVDIGGEKDDNAEEPAASKPGGLMGALIDAVSDESGTAPKVAKTAADQVLAELDALIGTQLNAIMGQEAFLRLEAAWRGLKFLLDRIDFRKDIQLEVLAAGKGDLSAALYHQVLLPEHRGEMEKPAVSGIILDAAFDNSSADVALLEDLAGTGASLQAPVIASAAPAFFGVSAYSGVATLGPLRQLFEQPAYIAWNKLREEKVSRYLALALPAFLLRASYGAKNPVGAFTFEETGALWGNASLAVAVAVAGSFARTGWPTHIAGGSRTVENLPLWKSKQGHSPLAALVPDAKLSEFSKGGFVVLGGKVNDDALHVARAMTACKPEAYEDLMAATEARIHITLSCTFFVARAAHHLLVIQGGIVPGTAVNEVQQAVEARLRAFLHTPGHTLPPDAVDVQMVDDSGVENQDLLAIRIIAPRYVLERPVSLVLGLPVPRS